MADAFYMNMEQPVVRISRIYLIYAWLNSTTGRRDKREFEGNCNKLVLLLRNGPCFPAFHCTESWTQIHADFNLQKFSRTSDCVPDL